MVITPPPYKFPATPESIAASPAPLVRWGFMERISIVPLRFGMNRAGYPIVVRVLP